MYLLTYRLYVMALHPYHLNASAALPARLSQVLVTSGMMVLELGRRLETDGEGTAFAPRRWYTGAYQQHQAALLLAAEVYHRPGTHAVDRIWPCLDYVFGLGVGLDTGAGSRREKLLRLLAEVQERTAVYTRLRRMRGPLHVTRSVPARNAVEGIGRVGGTLPSEQHQHQHYDKQHQQPQPQQQVNSQRYQPRRRSSDGGGDGNLIKVDPGYMAPPPTALAQIPQAARNGRPTTVLASQMIATFPNFIDGGQMTWTGSLSSSQYQQSPTMSRAGTVSVVATTMNNNSNGDNSGEASACNATDPDTIMDTIDWVCLR